MKKLILLLVIVFCTIGAKFGNLIVEKTSYVGTTQWNNGENIEGSVAVMPHLQQSQHHLQSL